MQGLETIDLSGNGLTVVQENLFNNNVNLKNILLSKNKLSGLYLRDQNNLHFIDLKDNYILYLKELSMNWLDDQNNESKNQSFSVDLRGNPFQCTCETLIFFRWLVKSQYVVTETPLICEWEAYSEEVTENFIQQKLKTCRNKHTSSWIFVTLGLCIPIVVFLLAVSGFKAFRRYYRRRVCRQNKERAIMLLQNHEFPYKYIIFVIFSSRDEEFVNQNICPCFEYSLEEITGVAGNFIAKGDEMFRPGHSILDEQERLLQTSAFV